MSNICQINGVNWAMAETAKSKHILDVFSALDERIELIFFALHLEIHMNKLNVFKVDLPFVTP